MPRILDLYCGAGGSAIGYRRAGFSVTGVDVVDQGNYPYSFIRGDVLALDHHWIAGEFDAVHASPPCQFATELNNDKSKHRNLIPQTRELLEKAGLPYVIENVVGAREHLREPLLLCGSMFLLGCVTSGGTFFQTRRHRLFETGFDCPPPLVPCNHYAPTVGVYGGHVRCRSASYWRDGGCDFPEQDRPRLAKMALGLPEDSPMTMMEMSQCVPPDYTRHIGKHLRNLING